VRFAEGVADDAHAEGQARRAASALYHVTSAILLASEGAHNPTDASRALISRMVLEHRLAPRDPMAGENLEGEPAMTAALLEDDSVSITNACNLLAA
jgi:acyl-CoA dehydrogenase